MGASISFTGTSFCKLDSECYKSTASAADKAKACCARYTITKLDATLPNHQSELNAVGFGGTGNKVGDSVKRCNPDYPTIFNPPYFQANAVMAGSEFAKAGVWVTAYCDGGETLAFVGKLTAATSMIYMSLF